MKKIFKHKVYSFTFLLIGAVWLFVLSLLFSNYWSYTSSIKGVRKNVEKYLHTQERDAYSLFNDSTLLVQIAHGNIGENENLRLVSKHYGLFIYKATENSNFELKYWNNQLVIPDEKFLKKEDGYYMKFLANGQYDLVVHQAFFNGERLKILVLIPLHWNFFIENSYLKNGFISQLNADKNFEITSSVTKFPVKSINGKILYYISEKKENSVSQNDWFTIVLRILSILLSILFIHEIALLISRNFGYFSGVAGLFILIFILRLFSYLFNFPFDFRQFELFSPSIFESNIFAKSLGDLIINLVLFLWVAIFLRDQLTLNNFKIKTSNILYRYILMVALVALFTIATIIFGFGLRSLVVDSAISFDVTNFFSLNKFTVFGFLALCLIAIAYTITAQILLLLINSLSEIKIIYRLLINLVLAILFIALIFGKFSYFHLGIVIWMIFYLVTAYNSFFNAKYSLTLMYSLRWIFIYSILIGIVIGSENAKKELEKRLNVSERVALEGDPFSESLFRITLSGLSNDFWYEKMQEIKKTKSDSEFSDYFLKSSFHSQFDKFQATICFFDSSGFPISSKPNYEYKKLNTIFLEKSKSTSVDGLRYHESDSVHFNYIYKKNIFDDYQRNIGFVFIITRPQRVNSELLLPELFNINNLNSLFKSSVYSYAIYNKGILIANYNDFSYAKKLTSQQVKFNKVKVEHLDGMSRLWYKKDKDRIILVVRKSNVILESITLFAYLFCVFLIMIGLMKLIGFIIDSGFKLEKFRTLIQFDIKTQIFTTIISISLFSFLIVCITTIYFFIDRYNSNNEERISKTIHIISNELKNDLNDEMESMLASIKSEISISPDVSDKILEIAQIHNVDINIYDLDGRLVLSSQPLIYLNSIMSTMMNPIAFHQLTRMQKVQFLHTEKTGNLEYLSIYKPLVNKDHNVNAYINIPYFTARNDLNQEISNFLVAIINFNTFIFLIGGLIAVFLTTRIASSFQWIGQKMRDVNIGANNELISWRRNDEIGGLVTEYNKMVVKLEDSVKLLAKNEREGAWREMARQVAHEIKNPLTPMKLSIQYLQRSIDTNAVNVKELTAAVAKTLIEQIEHLSKIASEFSQFANIGNVHNEVIDINTLLTSIISFHSTQEHRLIDWHPLADKNLIYADRTQLNRLFNNLIRNAIESIPDDRVGEIKIIEKVDNGHFILQICDNGVGISDDMFEKIFSPNFTTKTSGTGLGLAICKGIVEQAKGKIWFESIKNEGTCFYISLPIASVTLIE